VSRATPDLHSFPTRRSSDLELRLSSDLRKRFFKDTQGLAKEYGLNAKESAALETIKDENIDSLRSLKPHPLVDAGAHALGMLMRSEEHTSELQSRGHLVCRL